MSKLSTALRSALTLAAVAGASLALLSGALAGCASGSPTAPPRQAAAPSVQARQPERGEGAEVRAVVAEFLPQWLIDELEDGSGMVSDAFLITVVEPPELAGTRVWAYYQGVPELAGKRLAVGDKLRFRLPREAQRAGVLLWDLAELRLDAGTAGR